jgi:hypothetical protein
MRSKANSLLVGSIVFQTVLVAMALFLPFGFDRPSSIGLDYGHFLLLLSLYVVALVVGVIATFSTRRYLLAISQLSVPVVITWLGFAGILHL